MTANTTTVLPDARALNTDDARLALWQAIGAIKIGNPTDDKLIVAELAKQGVYLARFATPPASDAAVPAGEWNSPDLRDLQADIERFRSHDLGNSRHRELLRGAMDMIRSADVEMQHGK